MTYVRYALGVLGIVATAVLQGVMVGSVLVLAVSFVMQPRLEAERDRADRAQATVQTALPPLMSEISRLTNENQTLRRGGRCL